MYYTSVEYGGYGRDAGGAYSRDYDSSSTGSYSLRQSATVSHFSHDRAAGYASGPRSLGTAYRPSTSSSQSRPLVAPSSYVANAYSKHEYTGSLTRPYRPTQTSSNTGTYTRTNTYSPVTAPSRSTSVDRYAQMAARSVDTIRSQFERNNIRDDRDDGYSSTSTSLTRRRLPSTPTTPSALRYTVDDDYALESTDLVSSLPLTASANTGSNASGRYRSINAAGSGSQGLASSPSMPEVSTRRAAASFDRHQPSRASQSSSSTSSSSGCISDSMAARRHRSPSPVTKKTGLNGDTLTNGVHIDDNCGMRGLANIGNTVSGCNRSAGSLPSAVLHEQHLTMSKSHASIARL
jgi:hypothetical protein